MYSRFFRWSSDRIHDDGIVAFITNNSFLKKKNYDGFRKAVEAEFSDVYIVDLKGDARSSGEPRRKEGDNIFDNKIKVGVAICFLVKRKARTRFIANLVSVPDYMKLDEKLAFVSSLTLERRAFERLTPDKNGNWTGDTEVDWSHLAPIADPATKSAHSARQIKALFKDYSLGISTNRDEWIYGRDRKVISEKVQSFINTYNLTVRHNPKYTNEIKWSRNLKRRHQSGRSEEFQSSKIKAALYRPFTQRFIYQSPLFIDEMGSAATFFPNEKENEAICFNDIGSRTGQCILAANKPSDLHFGAAIDAYRQVARYRYTPSGERIDNITDWALKEFHKAYGKDGRGNPSWSGLSRSSTSSNGEDGGEGVDARHKGEHDGEDGAAVPEQPGCRKAKTKRVLSKDDIFHYVYGVLHDPVYRETYAQNLRREFPRIPFYPDFWRWAGWGERLMSLHIGYESVEPWPLQRLDVPDEKARAAGVAPKTILKADRDNGIIVLDSETQLSGVPPEAWAYKLGNRSGLDWVLDQHKEKTPKDPTIREKFNTYRFADYKEKVVDLLMRVTRVSVETVAITEAMKALRRQD
jgi:predicted helicase